LERLQRDAHDALRAAVEATRLPADVLLTKASRTPNGDVIVALDGCTRVPWLRVTINRLLGMALSAKADAAATAPEPQARDMAPDEREWFDRADELAAEFLGWLDANREPYELPGMAFARWREGNGIPSGPASQRILARWSERAKAVS
jgi:hypothetical protein